MPKKIVSFLIAFAIVASALTAILIGVKASTNQVSQTNYVAQLAAHATTMPHAQKGQIVDGSGKPLVLRGAEIESAFDNAGRWQNGTRLSSVLNPTVFNTMVQGWHMNALRLCLSNWIYTKDSTNYLKQLDLAVQQANTAGLYVILNLHDDAVAGSPYGDLANVPKAQSDAFWKVLAAHYKANPMVLFDLYNEPRVTSWPQWLNGGGKVGGATVVGHQTLVNTIRAAGAKQLVIVEPGTAGGRGKGWSTVGTSTINDPNVMYSLHVYTHIADAASLQDAKWGPILNNHPLFYGEWALLVNGASQFCQLIVPKQANQDTINFMKYMSSRNASWTAWEFGAYHLIQDYTKFMPTTLNIPWKCGNASSKAGMGTLVKQYLLTGK